MRKLGMRHGRGQPRSGHPGSAELARDPGDATPPRPLEPDVETREVERPSAPQAQGDPAQGARDGSDSAIEIEELVAAHFEEERPGTASSGGSDANDSRRSELAPFQASYQDGRYTTLGVLEKGGMSALLQVWDRDLGRTLVLKTLQPDSPRPDPEGEERGAPRRRASAKAIQRFLAEATITAQLDHPAVVPVYDLGVDDDGLPFFVMRQVKGQHLGEILRLARLKLKGWSDRRVLSVILRACQAVGYAHAKGIVHRDLKPENVMAAQLGQVYVMDWGLAKDSRRRRVDPPSRWAERIRCSPADGGKLPARDDRRPLLDTVEGTVVGTPIYMPPEQAAGRIGDVGPRSDVYSLGAILYTLLCGKRPYEDECRGKSVSRVIEVVTDHPPPSITRLNRGAPAPLVEICERAMARRAADRYPSGAELAEALQTCLYGGSPEPRHSSWLRRLGSSILRP